MSVWQKAQRCVWTGLSKARFLPKSLIPNLCSLQDERFSQDILYHATTACDRAGSGSECESRLVAPRHRLGKRQGLDVVDLGRGHGGAAE